MSFETVEYSGSV